MNKQEQDALLSSRQYWASNLEFMDWIFFIGKLGDGHYLQVQFDSEDNFNPGQSYKNKGRKWYLSPYMTESEFVFTAWAAIEFALLHEAREQFRYNSHLVTNPHVDIHALIEANYTSDIREDGKQQIDA